MGGAANSEGGPDATPGSEPFRGLRLVRAHPFPVGDRGAKPDRVLQRGARCRVKVNAGEMLRAVGVAFRAVGNIAHPTQ